MHTHTRFPSYHGDIAHETAWHGISLPPHTWSYLLPQTPSMPVNTHCFPGTHPPWINSPTGMHACTSIPGHSILKQWLASVICLNISSVSCMGRGWGREGEALGFPSGKTLEALWGGGGRKLGLFTLCPFRACLSPSLLPCCKAVGSGEVGHLPLPAYRLKMSSEEWKPLLPLGNFTGSKNISGAHGRKRHGQAGAVWCSHTCRKKEKETHT